MKLLLRLYLLRFTNQFTGHLKRHSISALALTGFTHQMVVSLSKRRIPLKPLNYLLMRSQDFIN